MIGLLLVLLLALGLPGLASAQSRTFVDVPVHNSMAFIGTGTGTIDSLPARSRSYLRLINDTSALFYCTVDGTEASANFGIRIDTHGGYVEFSPVVPRGPVRCYSATNGSRLLTVEGQ